MKSIRHAIEHAGLPESFCASPPSVMQDTLDHIITAYGSIDDYLRSIGVSKAQQLRIKLLLVSNESKL